MTSREEAKAETVQTRPDTTACAVTNRISATAYECPCCRRRAGGREDCRRESTAYRPGYATNWCGPGYASPSPPRPPSPPPHGLPPPRSTACPPPPPHPTP